VNVEGREYPELSWEIEADGAARFASAVGADVGDGVPPTYSAVYALFPTFGQLLADEEAAVDFRMLVHSEQEFEWLRHPIPGETVTSVGRVLEDKERRGMRFLTIATDSRDATGVQVCRSRMVVVIRGSQ
jgi:hypothetical protein